MRFFLSCLLCFVLTSAAAAADKVRVVTTLPDLADFAREVGGDRVEVRALLSGLEDVHSYEPKVSEVKALARARVLVGVGLGLEEWLQGLVANAGNGDLVVVEASKGVSFITDESRHGSAEAKAHGGGGVNPHVWLDPANAGIMCQNIAAALEAVDATAGDYYRKRLAAYLKRLEAAAGRLRSEVAGLKEKRFLSYHPAWPYFARGFGFTLAGVVVSDPSQEPSAKALAALVSRIRREKLRVLVTEPQLPSMIPRLLSQETGIRVVSLSDLVGYGAGRTYIDNIETNVRTLAEALAEARR